MPSPLGHALGGLAVGWLVAGPHRAMGRNDVRDGAWFAVAAMAADLDLLFGAHRGPTHGPVAACLAGLIVYAVSRRGLFAAAMAAAYATHPLLDWLGRDATPPIGIMALWPFSREYYESGAHVFLAISRRYWLREFWILNLHAAARELLVLGPLALLVARIRWRRGVSQESRRTGASP